MKKLFTTLVSCVAVAILIAPLALAQTPDGETPANEGVCDGLQGATPGLYGLCVAFCEAQDWADVAIPITEGDLEALELQPPSGRILANYNKKKKDGDPEMPCIKVQEPCPCWTQAELESIDSAGTDGSAFFCATNTDSIGFPWAKQISERAPLQTAIAFSGSEATPPNGFNQCIYSNQQVMPTEFRFLNLSPEEAANCRVAIQARCDLFGL